MEYLQRVNTHRTPLARAFYGRNTVEVARELLGKTLVRQLDDAILEATIVETEAYRGRDDPASHAYKGLTRRNRLMFEEPGHAYVYFTYGMHYCFNATTEPEGQPGAVLIRAVQPKRGIAKMKRQRRTIFTEGLANGPAKLTQALSVTKALNGHDLTSAKRLFIIDDPRPEKLNVVSDSRIGVRLGREKEWRFFIRGNSCVSRPQEPRLPVE